MADLCTELGPANPKTVFLFKNRASEFWGGDVIFVGNFEGRFRVEEHNVWSKDHDLTCIIFPLSDAEGTLEYDVQVFKPHEPKRGKHMLFHSEKPEKIMYFRMIRSKSFIPLDVLKSDFAKDGWLYYELTVKLADCKADPKLLNVSETMIPLSN